MQIPAMKHYALLMLVMLFCLNINAQDKLSMLRTNKQIITIEKPNAPYYTIQILALKLPPSDASFFKDLDKVYEYPCSDGYSRYTVGRYATFSEANASLQMVKEDGFDGAFVANTKRFQTTVSQFAQRQIEIVPSKDYAVQLSAFRYPVYVSFFENVDEVYEYRMNDKIFRYTTVPCKGTQVESVLEQMKSLGYKDAFIVEYDRFAPYRIE